MNVINNNFEKKDSVATYFKCQFQYEKITSIKSAHHNVQTSLRKMHRILKKLNLKRRNNKIDMKDITSKVAHENKEFGGCLDNRSMH